MIGAWAGVSWRWWLRVKIDRLSSPLSTMGQSSQSIRRQPVMPLMLWALLWKSRSTSGIFGMSFSPMFNSSPMRVSMPCLPTSAPSLPNASFSTPKPRRCLKSWSCNMQWDTMRPETGSRTSLSSPTNPFLPIVNCWRHNESSIRWPRWGNELTSLPSQQQPHHHPPYMLMPCPPTPAATIVAIPISSHQCPAQGQSSYACSSIGHYTALCKCKRTHQHQHNTSQWGDRGDRSTRGTRSLRCHQSPQSSNRCRGQHSSHSQGRLSCHHSPSHSQAHSPSCSPCHSAPPISLNNLITNIPPSSTPRTAWRSSQQIVLKPHPTLKVPCWLREYLMAKYHSTQGSSSPQRMVTSWWLWKFTLVPRWIPCPWAGTRSFPPQKSQWQ